MAWNVYFFQTTRGEYPVKDFVEKQDYRTRAKVGGYITLDRMREIL